MNRLGLALLLLGSVACAPHVQDDESGSFPAEREEPVVRYTERAPEAGAGAVIATMVTRDYRLAVRTTGEDPVFTVMRADGSVLAENLDLWQLARDYPELHRQFETAFAGEGIELDARADMLGRECEGCFEPGAPR